jgi:hypothetical protein
MTKRDFELIARAINKIQSLGAKRIAALALAAEIQNANPRFDTSKFLTACNLASENWIISMPDTA